MAADEDIQALLQTYARALREGDAALAASCFTRDGMFVPALALAARGSEIFGAYERLLAALRLGITFTVDELMVASETVVNGLTHSPGRQTVVTTGEESPEANREMWVFQQEDGTWKIHRYMFNTEQ